MFEDFKSVCRPFFFKKTANDSPDNRILRRRQMLGTGIFLIVLTALIAAIVLLGEKPASQRKSNAGHPITTSLTLRPDRADRDVFIQRFEGRLAHSETTLQALLKKIDTLDKSLGQERREREVRLSAAEKAIKNLPQGTPVTERDDVSEAADFSLSAPDYGALEGAIEQDPQKRARHDVPLSASRLTMLSLPVKAPALSNTALQHVSAERLNDAPVATNRALADANRWLPAGSFVPATLISGVYAGTGGAATTSPMPLLLRLDDVAILPNHWKSAVTSCHVTASATGDLSSERVLIRADRLSCIGEKGEMLDVRVTGYAVGEDGKTGIRGRLVTRSGQAIASALSLGVLSGLGKAVSLSAQETTTSSLTGSSTSNVSNPWKSGLGEGSTNALDRIMQYYLKLADKIFPVLEVDAGRRISLVFSQGVLLIDNEVQKQ